MESSKCRLQSTVPALFQRGSYSVSSVSSVPSVPAFQRNVSTLKAGMWLKMAKIITTFQLCPRSMDGPIWHEPGAGEAR
ncbi:hypothetical protein V493_07811 [Pseudogymnoascus sp. VKM F-4281 (FW-2241)]|nr:hypothetical protein V493_07811 [Pseudogymnoascus sp. VKM F-4281 (FW-2241)]